MGDTSVIGRMELFEANCKEAIMAAKRNFGAVMALTIIIVTVLAGCSAVGNMVASTGHSSAGTGAPASAPAVSRPRTTLVPTPVPN